MRYLFLLISLGLSLLVRAQVDNYGADKANKRYVPSSSSLGGRSDFNYLALADHPSRSGVPLGGIGAGNVEFAPNGRFVRIGLNNIHLPIERSTASFFALWYKAGGRTAARRLVLDSTGQYGMDGVRHTSYTGLFPKADLAINEPVVGCTIHAWSSLVPQDVKNSSLPMAFFDVELEAREDVDASVAFSWEDFIGRGIKDPLSVQGMDGQIFSRSSLVNGEEWPERAAVSTFSAPFEGQGFSGVRQYTAEPIIPRKATFQNYVDEVAVLARSDDGMVSSLGAFDIRSGAGWEAFVANGAFGPGGASGSGGASGLGGVSALSTPGVRNGGSAVAIKTSLKKGQRKTLRFMLVWYYPELIIDRQHAEPGSYWGGGSDYGRYFHNFFSDLSSVAGYGADRHDSLLRATSEWQEPVLHSSYPDWYKFKLINSAYVIYTNMILNKKGDVTINEGGMGGLAGTMDQRISSHPFYQKFFTQLDRSEMEIFGDAQAEDGSINHFIGHYYVGMGTVGGRVPTEGQWMLDNTEGWIIQVVKDYQQTGDEHYLRKYSGRIKDGMRFLKSKMAPGVEIPIGPTTYDDFKHPPVYSYEAGIYLATLKAAEVTAVTTGDSAWAKECREQFLRSQKDMMRFLWNGRFFAYGCEADGSGRLDSILFTGQLAGQFISRYCGWGDILPMDVIQSAIKAQFDISLAHTPDYYANKVWDMRLGHGIDQRGSQCWPFYLESYTAYTGIQAGYLDDGLDIMKHIQLVHLRKGLEWCQNLWNPGDITYMTGPVTWFSTDVLTGAGLDLSRGELRLAPGMEGSFPLYFPGFWAMLTVTRDKALLKVLKTFALPTAGGNDPVKITTIVVEPMGRATGQGSRITLPSPFAVSAGAVLDLSLWYPQLMQSGKKAALLGVK
jgi:non-lysosomal glucosylceramidase